MLHVIHYEREREREGRERGRERERERDRGSETDNGMREREGGRLYCVQIFEITVLKITACKLFNNVKTGH